MKYQITHKTWYAYEDLVPICHNLVHLSPRATSRQKCIAHWLEVAPEPAFLTHSSDYFGNRTEYFSIDGPHRRLEINATSIVEVAARRPIDPDTSSPWEACVPAASRDGENARGEPLDPMVMSMTFPSPRIPEASELRDYAAESFTANRPILTSLADLSARIYRDFKFDARATTVDTPLSQLLRLRRGVCQDFAHLATGCLRSMGLAARYTSGYLRTLPPPGKPRLIGADASHAWSSCWCGPLGWVDFDPTNNCFAGDSHVTIAWGRDYGDVCPIQGVFVGGGQHKIGISVDVAPAI